MGSGAARAEPASANSITTARLSRAAGFNGKSFFIPGIVNGLPHLMHHAWHGQFGKFLRLYPAVFDAFLILREKCGTAMAESQRKLEFEVRKHMAHGLIPFLPCPLGGRKAA